MPGPDLIETVQESRVSAGKLQQPQSVVPSRALLREIVPMILQDMEKDPRLEDVANYIRSRPEMIRFASTEELGRANMSAHGDVRDHAGAFANISTREILISSDYALDTIEALGKAGIVSREALVRNFKTAVGGSITHEATHVFEYDKLSKELGRPINIGAGADSEISADLNAGRYARLVQDTVTAWGGSMTDNFRSSMATILGMQGLGPDVPERVRESSAKETSAELDKKIIDTLTLEHENKRRFTADMVDLPPKPIIADTPDDEVAQLVRAALADKSSMRNPDMQWMNDPKAIAHVSRYYAGILGRN